MTAKEYLDNYTLGAIKTDSPKPVLIKVKQLMELLDNYYILKSKEEAEERYEKAMKLSGHNKNPSLIHILKVASGKEKS